MNKEAVLLSNRAGNCSGAPRVSRIYPNLTIIREGTLRFRNRDPKYCLLSEEWNPV